MAATSHAAATLAAVDDAARRRQCDRRRRDGVRGPVRRRSGFDRHWRRLLRAVVARRLRRRHRLQWLRTYADGGDAGMVRTPRHNDDRAPFAALPSPFRARWRLGRGSSRITAADRFKAALEPAIALARDGYAISPRVAHDIGKQRDLLRRDPTARRTFLTDGEAPSVGSVQRQPELAETLEAIGREGPAAFYRGPIAEDMIAYLRSSADCTRRTISLAPRAST